MVLNLDVRYALEIKSDVTLHTEAKTILAVCMHYARQARRELKCCPGNHYRGALSQPHFVCAQIETPKASGGNVGRGVPSTSDYGVRGAS